ncbi:hypothetical protein D3C84_1206180 [compost metagenome]
MQSGHEDPQLTAQRIGIALVIEQLTQGLARQWIVVHGIALDTRNTVNLTNRRAGDVPFTQRIAVVGKAFGVRVPRGRRQQAFAAKQFED